MLPIILIVLVLAVAGCLLAMVISAFGKRMIPLDIPLEHLPESLSGFRILLITDIHARRLPAKLLEPLRGRVDAVLLGGDLTQGGNPPERLRDNMRLAASIGPAYAVHGNHDGKADLAVVDAILRESGVRLLLDENVVLRHPGGELLLTGVDFPRTGGKRAYAPLPVREPGTEDLCRIILVHDPLWLEEREELPADLILAGHTHGGQVVPPLLERRHVEAFYREYSAGMYLLPRGSGPPVRLFISRGFGTAHLPLRFRSPAEMHVLTLRRGR